MTRDALRAMSLGFADSRRARIALALAGVETRRWRPVSPGRAGGRPDYPITYTPRRAAPANLTSVVPVSPTSSAGPSVTTNVPVWRNGFP